MHTTTERHPLSPTSDAPATAAAVCPDCGDAWGMHFSAERLAEKYGCTAKKESALVPGTLNPCGCSAMSPVKDCDECVKLRKRCFKCRR